MIKKLLIMSALFSMNLMAAQVNVNTADAKTIADSLSGVGLKKAQAIVDYRDKNGAFKTVDDLSHVSGIGTKTIEKNKADILLGETIPKDATAKTPNEEAAKPEKTKK